MKKLPITYPIITTVPMTADLLATIGGYEKIEPWICNNFNQVMYVRSDGKDEIYSFGTLFESQPKENNTIFQELPFVKYNKIKKPLLSELFATFGSFLIKCIDNDYYIRVALNYRYLSNIENDQEFVHMVLIYGYSMRDKVFYAADFHDGRKYGFYEYSFEDLEAAYTNSFVNASGLDEYLEDIIIYKVSEDVPEMILTPEKIREELTDFLNGLDGTCKYRNSYRWRNYDFYFGIDYFDELVKDIADDMVELNALHTLCDYFQMLKYKLNILKKHGHIILADYERLIGKLDNCLKQAILSRTLYLKYQINASVGAKNKVISLCGQMKELCKSTVEEIIVSIL